jgi:hypothetical protein
VTRSDGPRPRQPATTPAEVVPLLVVVVGMIVGLGLVFWSQWRLGCLIIGAALAIGGIERLLLPKDRAGLLQARSKFFDVIILLGMGASIIVLSIWVPSGRA